MPRSPQCASWDTITHALDLELLELELELEMKWVLIDVILRVKSSTISVKQGYSLVIGRPSSWLNKVLNLSFFGEWIELYYGTWWTKWTELWPNFWTRTWLNYELELWDCRVWKLYLERELELTKTSLLSLWTLKRSELITFIHSDWHGFASSFDIFGNIKNFTYSFR